MADYSCTYANLASTIAAVTTAGTYSLEITDPENVVFKRYNETDGFGGILKANTASNVYWDLSPTDFTNSQVSDNSSYDLGTIYGFFYDNITKIPKLPSALNTIKTAYGFFLGCKHLTEIPDISVITGTDVFTEFFSGCSRLTGDIALTNKNVVKANSMFDGCSELNSITVNFPNAENVDSMFNGCNKITSAVLTFSDKVESLTYLFYNCHLLTNISFLSSIKNVTDISYLVNNCTSLKSFDLSNFTSITNASASFDGCTSLAAITLPEEFPNLTNTLAMFRNTLLTSIDLKPFVDVNNSASMFSQCGSLASVSNFSYFGKNQSDFEAKNMFDSCSVLKSIDLTGIHTSKINMFNACTLLETITISSNLENVTNISDFAYCSSLKTFDFTKFPNLTEIEGYCFRRSGLESVSLVGFEKLKHIRYAFMQCYSIKTIKVENCQALYDVDEAFSECSAMTSATINNIGTNIDTSANYVDFSRTFSFCSSLATAEIINVNNASINNIFNRCEVLETVNFDKTYIFSAYGAFGGCAKLTSVSTIHLVSAPASASYSQFTTMFSGCKVLASVAFDGNVSSGIACSFEGMFSGCSSITSISNLKALYNLKSNNYSRMFNGCTSLKTLDISGMLSANAANGYNAYSMFEGCTALETITGFDELFSNTITSYSRMFYGCTNLVIDNADFTNVQQASNQTAMFYGCTKLKKATNVTVSMASMFEGCTALESVSFNSNNVMITGCSRMFYNCSSLKEINGNIKLYGCTSDTASDMFNGCTSLKSVQLDNSSFKVYYTTTYYETRSNINTSINNISCMFNGCTSLETVDITGITGTISTPASAFTGCSSLKKLKIASNITDTVVSGSTGYSVPVVIEFSGTPGMSSSSAMLASAKAITYPSDKASDYTTWKAASTTVIPSSCVELPVYGKKGYIYWNKA